MNQFIQKLQSSEEHVKLRWLIGISAITMIIVVFVWLSYFNTLVQSSTSTDLSDTQGVGFWQTFKGGLAFIGQSFGDEVKTLFGKIKSPSTYQVK
jgi:hypothetical protein